MLRTILLPTGLPLLMRWILRHHRFEMKKTLRNTFAAWDGLRPKSMKAVLTHPHNGLMQVDYCKNSGPRAFQPRS
eukprot:5222557-Karenia_brevis.AAC.1